METRTETIPSSTVPAATLKSVVIAIAGKRW